MLTSLFGWLWRMRRALPYNSEGRYFHAVSGVVYYQGAVTAYGGDAMVAGLLTMLLAKWARRN